MTLTEAVKTIMKRKKITQVELADKLGTKQNNIAMFLKNNYSTKVENLLRMANACGYDVVLVDRDDHSNTYVIGEGESVQLQQNAGDESFDERVRRIVADELAKHEKSTTPSSSEN